MGISSYLSKFALGITPEGVLSALYGGTGTTTGGGSVSTSPTVTSIYYLDNDSATNIAGGDTITLIGTNFNVGVTVLVGTTQVSQVTRVSSTQLTFLAPANSAGSYILYVVNSDGSSAISIPGIQYSGVPSWTTASGSLGNVNSATSISTTVAATGDAPVSYAIVSGALPAGVTLNTSTGVISGTTPSVSSSTTYNFTIRATDAQNQDTNRAFSLTIAAQTTYSISPATTSISEGSTLTLNISGTNVTDGTYYWTVNTNNSDFATSSGSFTITSNVGSFTVTPAADTTTEGAETFTISIRSGSTSGTVLATSSSITINDTSTTPEVVASGDANYTIPGTYQWTAPAGVTSVCVVAVGGGGGGNRSVIVKPGDDDEFYWSGGGGALAWKNNITVVPGQSYEVIVGARGNKWVYGNYNTATAGGDSSFGSGQMGQVVKAGGGKTSISTGAYSAGALGGQLIAGTGGGNGGNGGNYGGGTAGGYNPGGGGAGGYSGAGGAGANGGALNYTAAPSGSAGSGGGGGGGAGGGRTIYPDAGAYGGGGGGVGIYGQGSSGSGGSNYSIAYMGGAGGSGGGDGGYGGSAPNYDYAGGLYGGGGGLDSNGGQGAVRIIWGSGRAFPSTNVTSV